MVTAKLICVFVFAYADCWFSHDLAHTILLIILGMWSFGTSLTDSYEVACAWSLKQILRKDWYLLLFSVAIRFFLQALSMDFVKYHRSSL